MKKVLFAFVAFMALVLASCGNQEPKVIIVKDTIVIDKSKEAEPAAEKPEAKPAPKKKAEPKGPSQLSKQEAEYKAPAPRSSREHWSGSIGGKYKINMYINENTGEFWYNYTKYPNGKLWLRVVEHYGNYFELVETNEYGEDTGMFAGTISGNRFTGTFTNFARNQSYSFTLNRMN